MGKKVKVDINGKPLEAVTIGEIKKNKFGWIGLVLLFALFIGVIYFLPELQKFYQEYKNGSVPTSISGSNTNTSNNTVVNNTNTNTSNNTVSNMYVFGEDKEVTVGNVTFSSINLSEDNQLTFTIKNTNDSRLNLSKLNLFLEAYDESTLVNRVAIKGSISSNDSKNFSYKLKASANKYEIKVINEEDYTYIDLNIDDNKVSTLTCTNGDETLVYTFNDEKLTKIKHTANYLKTADNYDEIYSNLNTNVVKYESQDGVNVSLKTNETNLIYTMEIDYSKYTGSISNNYYFKKDTSPRIVNFEVEALLFTCS